jgi:hypothetical protein
MTIKYGLQFFFFEMSQDDGQNFLAAIVHVYKLAQKSVSVYGGVAYLDHSGVSLYF